jgi:hypothetical protein
LVWVIVAGIVSALAVPALAEEPLGPYLLSLEGREAGRLTGRLFFESAKPGGAAKPLAGVALLALPSAPPLWAGLGQLRQEYRASGAEYRNVLGKFERLVQDYRQRVETEGGSKLVRTTVVDDEGRFELVLPGGNWVLVVNHSTVTPIKGPPPKAKRPPPPASSGGFGPPSFLPGPAPPTKVREVSLWAYRIDVPAGGGVKVELHDRNRWLVHLIRE